MCSRSFWVLAVICLAATNAGSVQNPLQVESSHYKLAFANDAVQVVYIHYGPHEKSVLHQHPAGVVVNLTDGHLRFTDASGATQEVRAIHGEARWFPPVKHKVENLSDTAYDGVYIGVKGKTATAGLPQGAITRDPAVNAMLLSIMQGSQTATK
jgi:beta-alanine degradation protein BauB